jgi:hypothetical protein
MTSWSDPQTIVALIGAFTAFVVAIGALWHSIQTRGVANAANTNAQNAGKAAAHTMGMILARTLPSPSDPK